jgi:hypothetical protein
LSKLHAKLFYLEQLMVNPAHHRIIANRMATRFQVSAAQIKDELLAGGYIKLDKVVRMGETRKNNHFYVLTDKKFTYTEEIKVPKSAEFWPCGTKKSTGNAFDLSSAKGLFSKSEIASLQNKGKPQNHTQVIAYSRA